MKISDWLDEKEAEIGDVSQITLPRNMAYDSDPDETIFLNSRDALLVYLLRLRRSGAHSDFHHSIGIDQV